MPLGDFFSVGNSGRGAFWICSEQENELRPQISLSEEEEILLASFSYERRRAQWLATRILLQELLPGAAMAYDENGKPFLTNQPGWYVSLSHSHEMLVMLIDRKPTGIDIERIRENISRIAPKFLNDDELAFCAGQTDIRFLHCYWCIKEAVYKVHGLKGVSLKSNIFAESVQSPEKGIAVCHYRFGDIRESFRVQYEQRGEWMMAYLIS